MPHETATGKSISLFVINTSDWRADMRRQSRFYNLRVCTLQRKGELWRTLMLLSFAR